MPLQLLLGGELWRQALFAEEAQFPDALQELAMPDGLLHCGSAVDGRIELNKTTATLCAPLAEGRHPLRALRVNHFQVQATCTEFRVQTVATRQVLPQLEHIAVVLQSRKAITELLEAELALTTAVKMPPPTNCGAPVAACGQKLEECLVPSGRGSRRAPAGPTANCGPGCC